MKYLFILLVIFTWSCGFKQWSSKGINHGWLKSDTITDTLYTKEIQTDTIFKHNYIRDTVILKENKLTIKYFYNNSDSTVYLSGKCESDTIVVEKVVNTVTHGQQQNWIYLVIIAGLFLLIVLLKR